MLKIISNPTEKAYSLDSVKAELRVLDNEQDAEIILKADVYLLRAEEITNLVLQGLTTFEYSFIGNFKDVVLPKNPFASIVKIEYLDSTDTKVELEDSKYEIDYPFSCTRYPCKLSFISPPVAKKVFITFVAGFETIDPRVQQWVNIKTQYIFDSVLDKEQSKYIDNLLASLRIVPI